MARKRAPSINSAIDNYSFRTGKEDDQSFQSYDGGGKYDTESKDILNKDLGRENRDKESVYELADSKWNIEDDKLFQSTFDQPIHPPYLTISE